MKTPVINSHKIEMTARFVSNKNFFSFIMPSVYNKNTLPIPIDNRILIKVEPEKKMAVIKANGYLSTKKIKKFHHLLFKQLRNNAIEVKESSVIMRYNSPFTPPFMRKNKRHCDLILINLKYFYRLLCIVGFIHPYSQLIPLL